LSELSTSFEEKKNMKEENIEHLKKISDRTGLLPNNSRDVNKWKVAQFFGTAFTVVSFVDKI